MTPLHDADIFGDIVIVARPYVIVAGQNGKEAAHRNVLNSWILRLTYVSSEAIKAYLVLPRERDAVIADIRKPEFTHDVRPAPGVAEGGVVPTMRLATETGQNVLILNSRPR